MKYRDWRYELKEVGWHKHFAWLPVKIDHKGGTAWLKFVERRLDGWVSGPFGFQQWSYRLHEGAEEVGFQ